MPDMIRLVSSAHERSQERMLGLEDAAGVFDKRLLPDPHKEVWTGHLIQAVLARQIGISRSDQNQLYGN